MRFGRLAFALGIACFIAGQARAAISYSYVTDSQTYMGTSGSTVTVAIYLQETLTSGSTSYINNIGGGLTGAGASLAYVSTTGGTNAQVVSGSFNNTSPATGLSGGPQARSYNDNGGGNNSGGNNLQFTEAVTATPINTTANALGGAIYLGSVNITVGTGTSKYNLTSLDNSTVSGGGNLGGSGSVASLTENPSPNGSNLDVSLGSTYTGADSAALYTFTVGAAVPEPSSAILTGLAFAGLAFGAYRRQAKNATTEAASVA